MRFRSLNDVPAHLRDRLVGSDGKPVDAASLPKRKGKARQNQTLIQVPGYGQMNRTEKRALDWILAQLPAPDRVWREPTKWRLAQNCWWKPDFGAIFGLQLVQYEVKAEKAGKPFWSADARTKFLAVREQFAPIKFVLLVVGETVREEPGTGRSGRA